MRAGELDRLVDVATAAALAGGDVVREGFGRARDVRSKAPGDYVSEVDVAAERAVRAVLEGDRGGHPVHGEEEGGERAEIGWFVDPLDGTANFLHDFPMVGVSVALVESGRPVVGVIHAPLLGFVVAGRAGGGAHRDGKPVRVSSRAPEHAISATGFPFRRADRLPRYLPAFEAALADLEDLRRAGAASLDLAYTATGSFDGFFELGLGPWDVAAGGLLVREAGGVVTDWEGDDTAWLERGDIVAGPLAVHARLLELVAVRARDSGRSGRSGGFRPGGNTGGGKTV